MDNDIKIKGKKTEFIDVTISQYDLLKECLSIYKKHLFPIDILNSIGYLDPYISTDGYWETWGAGRGGSGYTDRYRIASQAEIDNYQLYQAISSFHTKINNTK